MPVVKTLNLFSVGLAWLLLLAYLFMYFEASYCSIFLSSLVPGRARQASVFEECNQNVEEHFQF
jgi:hypothetical protein